MAKDPTPKQMLFALEYMKDLNATRAYREVYGVKQKVAEANGPRLLGNARVAALISGAIQKRADRLEVNADKVLTEIGHVAYLDPLEMYDENNCLKPIAEIPEHVRRAIASIETKELFEGTGEDREMIGYTKTVKLWNKPGSLELHGKHLKLFTDRVEHSGTVTIEDFVSASRHPENGVNRITAHTNGNHR